MTEMNELYDTFTRIKEEVQGLNLEEVGAFRLREYKRRFEGLLRRARELATASRKNDAIDNDELLQMLTVSGKMNSEASQTIIPMVEIIDIKMTLGKDVASERHHLRELKEENLKTIKKLQNQAKRFKKSVEKVDDPELRSVLDEKIAADEETINRLKELDARYDARIKDLGEKLRIIALGGKLKELEDIRKETTGLEPDEATRLADEMVKDGETVTTEPTEETVDSVTPIKGGEGTELPVEPLVPPTPPVGTRTAEGTELPVPPLTGGSTEGTELPVPPLTRGSSEGTELPVPPLTGGSTEGTELPVPPLTGGTTELPVPPLTGGSTEGTELPVPPLTETPGETPSETPAERHEEEEPVPAKVKKPKASIWKKVRNALIAATLFLLTSITIHTGITAHNSKTQKKVAPKPDTEIEEETENPIETETPTAEPTAEPTEEPTAEPSYEPVAPETTPAPTAEPTAEPTPEPTAEPTPTPAPTPNIPVGEDDVVLESGESVYDANTGVEVGANGNASKETNKGTTPQATRNVEDAGNGLVVVRNEHLQPDPTPTAPLPTTGKEISEEEARANQTETQNENLTNAINDLPWDDLFESSFGK